MDPPSRVSINEGTLSISDVIVTDSAYYSAEVETKSGRRELFQFWLFVKGIFDGELYILCEKCPKKCVNTIPLFPVVDNSGRSS